MKQRLYIAYGSNLNIEQMAVRCPTARIIDKGTIEGYELLFRGGDGHSVATIEQKEGSYVPVLVWNIRPSDEKSLDIYEGHPHFYRKEDLTALCSGRKLPAMVYIMNDGRPFGSPSSHYLSTIARGYETAGFDMDVLNDAVEISMHRRKENSPASFRNDKVFSFENLKYRGWNPWPEETDSTYNTEKAMQNSEEKPEWTSEEEEQEDGQLTLSSFRWW